MGKYDTYKQNFNKNKNYYKGRTQTHVTVFHVSNAFYYYRKTVSPKIDIYIHVRTNVLTKMYKFLKI